MTNREKLIELLSEVQYLGGLEEKVADRLIANGVVISNSETTTRRWIPVAERLPEENEYVMIWCGKHQIARIERGISEEQRKAMKRGELYDPCETGWTLSNGYFTLKRSQAYKACDKQGNNRVPYCWYANGGPMKWFGQEVTHWAHLPKPPKGE